MVVIENPENYTLLKIVKANDSKHKYTAILKNKKTNRTRNVNFGAIGYEQYFDRLGSYSKVNHLDKKRRTLYRQRHAGEEARKFSSGYFSWYYLW